MDLACRGECVAMDMVSGKESFPATPRGNKYILTIIDCFTRFAVAVPIPDQYSEVLVNTVLSHYILFYGTPRCILSDQKRNFESL